MAGTITAASLDSGASSTAPLFKANGTEIGTLCRAWVNFDGSGTVAIRASFNVSSITDNGTGDYTVNFTTAMPDANYCVSSVHGRIGRILTGNGANDSTPPNWTTTSCRMVASTAEISPTFSDYSHLTIAIHR
jgi:hypothetical protein